MVAVVVAVGEVVRLIGLVEGNWLGEGLSVVLARVGCKGKGKGNGDNNVGHDVTRVEGVTPAGDTNGDRLVRIVGSVVAEVIPPMTDGRSVPVGFDER